MALATDTFEAEGDFAELVEGAVRP